MSESTIQINSLQQRFKNKNEPELLILIGSRATGSNCPDSDWDFAFRFSVNDSNYMERLAKTEELRHDLADALNTVREKIDLIDIAAANLTMRAIIAEEGIPVKGGDQVAWYRFLTRTWRELEYWYWEREHEA